MRVTNLKHENSASNNIVLNSDGSVGGDLATTLASKLDLAGGKILQIVRATDTTQRSTTSTSLVDVTGMSVTITPQKSDSAIIVIATCIVESYRTSGSPTDYKVTLAITDSSDNAISGAELVNVNQLYQTYPGASAVDRDAATLVAYATPATTSATTYKLRFRTGTTDITALVRNQLTTGQMYAIEVSA